MEPEFRTFPKITRLCNECMVITEKIDGTNAQVTITEDGRVLAGSRNRWITPEADNFSFAAWVRDHATELLTLGPGTHYGEWYGVGIQRGYGLYDRRFSLFNTMRWEEGRPACVGLVPVLYKGPVDTSKVQEWLDTLIRGGSFAVPGFMKPEGLVIYHASTRATYKKLIENDNQPKSAVSQEAAVV